MEKLKQLYKDPVGVADVQQERRDITVNSIKSFMFREMKKFAVIRFSEEFDEKYKYTEMYNQKSKYSNELSLRLKNFISGGGKFDNLIFVTEIIREYQKNFNIIEAEYNKQEQGFNAAVLSMNF